MVSIQRIKGLGSSATPRWRTRIHRRSGSHLGQVVFDVTEHHLLIGLLTPLHSAGRIGIGRIAGAVVVASDALEDTAGRQVDVLGQAVEQLPVEIITRNIQKGLRRAPRQFEFIPVSLPADMHVRHEGHQSRGLRHR